MYFVSKYSGGGPGYGVGLGWNSSGYAFVGTDGGGPLEVRATLIDLYDNLWHHVVFVHRVGVAVLSSVTKQLLKKRPASGNGLQGKQEEIYH